MSKRMISENIIQDKSDFIDFIHALQDSICKNIENTDSKAKFEEDHWERPGGGGGRTRIIRNGKVFEKGGVNISTVHGVLPDSMKQNLKTIHSQFFACGLSLVLHPLNPMVPTVHANFRYFELYDENGEQVDCWFGGGSDLTPYYIFPEDGIHFHRTLKNACDETDDNFYPEFKKQCDNYFVNKHRNNEARGIGGIFYDYLRPNEKHNWETLAAFSQAAGNSFTEAYLPIVEKRKGLPYSQEQRHWQGIRRGRYVEFNLVHDKGTLFGLKTNGRTESILMSLPPNAIWEYDYIPPEGSEEAKILEYLKPRDWVNDFKTEVLLNIPNANKN